MFAANGGRSPKNVSGRHNNGVPGAPKDNSFGFGGGARPSTGRERDLRAGALRWGPAIDQSLDGSVSRSRTLRHPSGRGLDAPFQIGAPKLQECLITSLMDGFRMACLSGFFFKIPRPRSEARYLRHFRCSFFIRCHGPAAVLCILPGR